MNLILLHKKDFVGQNRVRLHGRRREHIYSIQHAVVGDKLRVGKLGGLIGTGKIVSLTDKELEMEIQLDRHPPNSLPITLLLALPRPKMLKRILQSVSSLGVKKIYLINSYRVDKSFWGSPLLQSKKLNEQLMLGLEQACDTILPEIYLRPRFKPFVEDELPKISQKTTAYVAHPGVETTCPGKFNQPTTLAIGPEGGFISYEVEKLQDCRFLPISLGKRILRVETAVPVLLSRFTLNPDL
jgi:RsmE family RNA methyltransferase